MGMYDSVMVNCPECGAEVEFQSKSGDCLLMVYHASGVPSEIARDIEGDREICRCGCVMRLAYVKPPAKLVCMTAVSCSQDEADQDEDC
jgi:hypothetical protein